jgi:hypothetical protein
MNDLNQLEKHLRSWTPRQPSAALKARVFNLSILPEKVDVEPGVPAWQWLAPAMAVFVVAMMSWTDGARSSFISGDLKAGSALSNPELATYYSPTHIEHNAWPRATFDWTNERHTLSTPAPVLVTNSTIP